MAGLRYFSFSVFNIFNLFIRGETQVVERNLISIEILSSETFNALMSLFYG